MLSELRLGWGKWGACLGPPFLKCCGAPFIKLLISLVLYMWVFLPVLLHRNASDSLRFE